MTTEQQLDDANLAIVLLKDQLATAHISLEWHRVRRKNLIAQLAELKEEFGAPLYHAAQLREIDDPRKDETLTFLAALNHAFTP